MVAASLIGNELLGGPRSRVGSITEMDADEDRSTEAVGFIWLRCENHLKCERQESHGVGASNEESLGKLLGWAFNHFFFCGASLAS